MIAARENCAPVNLLETNEQLSVPYGTVFESTANMVSCPPLTPSR